jgi:DNA polymerase-4
VRVNVLLFAPFRMKRGGSECAPPCPHFVLKVCVPMLCSSHQMFRDIEPARAWRTRFFGDTRIGGLLSLDEAYLEVTENKTGLPTATRVARPFVSRFAKNCD